MSKFKIIMNVLMFVIYSALIIISIYLVCDPDTVNLAYKTIMYSILVQLLSSIFIFKHYVSAVYTMLSNVFIWSYILYVIPKIEDPSVLLTGIVYVILSLGLTSIKEIFTTEYQKERK